MTTSEKPKFLLLFRHPEESPDPTPEEMQVIFGKWMTWIRNMKAAGQLCGTNRLQEGGTVLRPCGGPTTDGPFAEAKEVIGGYVLVAADDLASATEIAKGCPGLEGGTIVEVRPVEPLPPI